MLLTITQVRILVCLSPWDYALQAGACVGIPSSVATAVSSATCSVATAVAAARSRVAPTSTSVATAHPSVAAGHSLSRSDAGVTSANSLPIGVVDCSSRLRRLEVAEGVSSLRTILASYASTHTRRSTTAASAMVATMPVSLMPNQTTTTCACR